MASLRKRPADDVVATDAAVPEVAISIETNAPPAPEASAPNNASEALRAQIEALNQARTLGHQAATANERRQAWLEATPGAKDHIPALGHIHQAALNAGLVDTSPEYFDFMGSQLAALQAQRPAAAATHLAEEMQQRAAQDRAPEPPPRPTRVQYSAPPSRDVPNSSGKRQSNGKITLTPQEVEAARISGISLEMYAKQKLRKAEMIASGEYGEQQR